MRIFLEIIATIIFFLYFQTPGNNTKLSDNNESRINKYVIPNIFKQITKTETE